MDISSWCNRIIRSGFYLLFFLVPLLLTPWNYELFEFNKMVTVYALTTIIIGAWIVKMVSDKEIRITRTPLDIPILLFVGSQFVSALFSIDPHVSWFGYYSRFNGGMWSIISYVLLFYAFVTNFSSQSDSDVNSQVKSTKSPARNAMQSVAGGKVKSPNGESLTIQQSNNVTIFLHVILASGFLVAIYGVLERLGIDKHLWVQDVQNRVFSTLGQPNWLGAYMVVLILIATGFVLNSQFTIHNIQQGKKDLNWSLRFVIWTLTAVLFFLVLLFTRSRSGLLAFAAADVIFWVLAFSHLSRSHLYAEKVRPFQANYLFKPFFLLHFSFFLIVFFNGSYIDSVDRWLTLRGWINRMNTSTIQQPASPAGGFNNATMSPSATPSGTLLEVGGTESGKIRKFVWQGAINAWRGSWKNFLVGTGTETFAFAFYQYRPAGHNLTSEWDFLYNKAHNEYLNYLATTGLFGLISYLAFIGIFIVWFIKFSIFNFQFSMKISNYKLQIEKNNNEIANVTFLKLALFSAWISILITNFFGFSVVVMQIFFFLIPAFLFILSELNNTSKAFVIPLTFPQSYRKIANIVFVGISLALLYRIFTYWQGDTLFASGYRASRTGAYEKAQSLFSQAIQRNHNEPMYHDELGTVLASLSIQALDAQDATKGATLAKQALEESDKALGTSPRNVNFWKSRTKIFYAFSQFDPSFIDASIKSLERAKDLSPSDPKIFYNLAVLEGQLTHYDTAIDYLITAKTLKTNYRDVFFALSVFYKEMKKPDRAKAVLQEYLTNVDPTDKEFLIEVEK